MLSALQRRFPLFMKDICRTFGGFVPGSDNTLCNIPTYITPELIKYCNTTNNPKCDDFLGTIPSYFLANHCDNHRSVTIVNMTNENETNNKK